MRQTPKPKSDAADGPATFVARFVTTGQISTIDDWLRGNARGLWTLKFQGLADDGHAKSYAITFGLKTDRTLFRQRFTLQ